ncbi:hypothetical protein ACLB2K_002364 [Fragaria x ananassa]
MCFFIIDFNDVKAIKWINKMAASVFREWKHDLSEIHKLGGRDVIPEELLHRQDEWEWLCTHFESDKSKRRSVANSSNRGKKELEHYSGRKPIIYWVAELRDKGVSLPVVDVYPVTYDINQPKAAEHYQLRSSFPVGHPSWDCSSINMLNLGVPIPSEAAEPPKGLVLDWRWACTYTAHNPSPFGRCGLLQNHATFQNYRDDLLASLEAFVVCDDTMGVHSMVFDCYIVKLMPVAYFM